MLDRRTVLAFAFLAPPCLLGQEQERPWPREFETRPAKVVITTEGTRPTQVATTRRFRIESETPINRPDLERFATVVESVPQVVQALPLPLWSPPARERVPIRIFENEASFLKAGGKGATVGWYDGHRDRVLIRADYFLRPPSHQPTRLAPRPNQNLLVHELVHTSMDGLLWRLPPWLSEGIAEYISVCHRGNGYYTFHDIVASLRDRIRRSVGTTQDGHLALLPVGDILALDHREWLATARDFTSQNPYLPYATSLLLAHYHFNGGQQRREQLATYLSALHRLPFHEPTPPFLTEPADEIQQKLIKFWAPRGLPLRFAAP